MRLFLFLSIIAALTSCGNKQTKQQDEGKTVFKYNEAAGITSLDPAFCRNVENIWAVNQVFNGLVQMDTELKVQPCIAESWEVDSSGTVYTFKLRNDVFFHDHELFPNGKGRKVTAQDFVYSFQRILDPAVASPGDWIFNQVDRSERSNFKGFVAEDEQTLKIFLIEPFPPFLGILTMQYCSVVPKEIVDYYQSDFRRNPVGTGPFKYKVWKEGVKMVLVKNENYWEKDGDNQLPYLDAVAITFVKERQVAFLDFLQGKYDFVSGIDAVASYKDEIFNEDGELTPKYSKDIVLEKLPYLKTDYLGIVIDPELDIVKNSPLKEKAIRQAINYGFDRQKMIKYIRSNIGRPAAAGFIPKGLPAYSEDEVKGYSYNPEKAKELLYVAGFPEGKGLPEFKLTTTAANEKEAEYIQHELGDIGLKVAIDVADAATYREMVAQSKLGIFRKSWIADYPDAENFLALFYSKNYSPKGPNYTHFSNSQFDYLYEKSLTETNDSLRHHYYREMDKLVMEQSSVVPLFYDEVIRLVQKDVEGLEGNPMNLLNLKKVKKVSEQSPAES